MLTLKDIHTYYGDSYILQGISMRVDYGSVVALLGRNGVGKTTLIHSIIGFTPPRQGEIRFKETAITDLPSFQIARMGIGLIPQGMRIFPSLTVKENLTVVARNKQQMDNLEKIYSIFPRLKERAGNKGNQLSGGERQMLAIGRSLMMDPELILMDEPSAGLAPLLVRDLGLTIRRLKEQQLTIFIVEQNVSLALSLADDVYVMSKGRIVHQSSPQELANNQEIKSRYLGF
jgi:branched-chain amino acid transport system ATP-binding protein